MCKVKTGKNICTDRDVQNLITSVILRQKRTFDSTAIILQTRNKLKDSEINLEDVQVEKMIFNTLGVLECNGVVGRKDGMYSKKQMLFV